MLLMVVSVLVDVASRMTEGAVLAGCPGYRECLTDSVEGHQALWLWLLTSSQHIHGLVGLGWTTFLLGQVGTKLVHVEMAANPLWMVCAVPGMSLLISDQCKKSRDIEQKLDEIVCSI